MPSGVDAAMHHVERVVALVRKPALKGSYRRAMRRRS
jgi:hypothetical protein